MKTADESDSASDMISRECAFKKSATGSVNSGTIGFARRFLGFEVILAVVVFLIVTTCRRFSDFLRGDLLVGLAGRERPVDLEPAEAGLLE